ncbi:MAG TPA: type II toxin-antitoxin system RelE/ParE family toxin [Nitrospirota bacterium]|nr:type II toxin-antitoxin system RelE/ParE family toxin [Nitrospirota bacterium]
MMKLPGLHTSKETAELIRSLHPELRKKIHYGLQSIREDPCGGKPLQNELEGLRSFRVGKFRIIYRITEKRAIEIVTVGPRRTVYDETVRAIEKSKE